MGAPQCPPAREGLKPMGSAAAAAKGSGWGIGAAIWTSAIQNTQNKRGCQAIKRLLKKH